MIQRFAGRTLSLFLSFFPPSGWKKPCSWVGTRVFDRTHAYYNCGYVLCAHRPAKRTRANNGVAVAQLLIVARVHAVEQAGGERSSLASSVRESARLTTLWWGRRRSLKRFSNFDCKIMIIAILLFGRN